MSALVETSESHSGASQRNSSSGEPSRPFPGAPTPLGTGRSKSLYLPGMHAKKGSPSKGSPSKGSPTLAPEKMLPQWEPVAAALPAAEGRGRVRSKSIVASTSLLHGHSPPQRRSSYS